MLYFSAYSFPHHVRVRSIRAGLAFQLKERVGSELIARLEAAAVLAARPRLLAHPNIALLGGGSVHHHQLPIFSFLVCKHNSGPTVNIC